MVRASSKLYEQDFYLWLEEQVQALQESRYSDLDIGNLIEELEALGRAEKHAVLSHLRVLLIHLLKWQYQPDRRTSSWISTINTQRHDLDLLLTVTLKRHLEENFESTYAKARRDAARETNLSLETFPHQCSFSVIHVLDEDFFPNQHD